MICVQDGEHPSIGHLHWRGRAILAGVGAATLAMEYPEKFRQLWERAPEYMDRGNEMMAAISRIAQRLADLPIGGGSSEWRESVQ